MLDQVQNLWLFGAGAAAAGTALLHLFAARKDVVLPLLGAKDIHSVSKYTNYYCWHLVSITLVAMAVAFVWASIDPAQTGLAWMWTVIAALFAMWSIVLVIWKRQNPWHMPQWLLFITITGLAGMGLWA